MGSEFYTMKSDVENTGHFVHDRLDALVCGARARQPSCLRETNSERSLTVAITT